LTDDKIKFWLFFFNTVKLKTLWNCFNYWLALAIKRNLICHIINGFIINNILIGLPSKQSILAQLSYNNNNISNSYVKNSSRIIIVKHKQSLFKNISKKWSKVIMFCHTFSNFCMCFLCDNIYWTKKREIGKIGIERNFVKHWRWSIW